MWSLLVLLPFLAGSDCGGGDGGGGSPTVLRLESPDRRCVALADPAGFPPDFDFVAEAAGAAAPTRVLAATASLSNLIPIEVEDVPFRVPEDAASYQLAADADGDGKVEFFKSIARVATLDPQLALVSVSGNLDAVLFVDPLAVASRPVRVVVPPDFDPALYAAFPGLPAPGSERLQTGVTTSACMAPGPDARDSRQERLEDAVAPAFWCDGPATYPASFPSALAVVGGRLFAAVANVGVEPGQEDTQYLPGAVVVDDLDLALEPPVVTPSTDTPDGRPYVLTSHFNPTGLTPYTTPAGRPLLLVTLTGAIGIRADDPNTDELESGTLPITPGAVDVLDPETLELVATIPMRGTNPAFRGIALDPTGQIGLLGDVAARRLYAIDLRALAALPASGPPVQLDAAVIFDGTNPLVIPGVAGGAPESTCPGRIEGVAFAHAEPGETQHTAWALESCDGSLATVSVDLQGSPSTAELRTRIEVARVFPVTAALRADTFDQLRAPTALRVRPGRPGLDYRGPDVFFLVSEPEGFLCGIELAPR